MLDEQLLTEIAAFYNAGASRNPANPPTRREIAEQFHLRSPSTAQNYLNILEARHLVPPLRRNGRRGRPRQRSNA